MDSRPVGRRYVLPETTALAVIGCADLLSTVYLVATGRAHEGNPLMAALFTAFGPRGLICGKFVLLAAPLTVAESARRRNPEFVRRALRVCLLLYVVFYVANLLRVR